MLCFFQVNVVGCLNFRGHCFTLPVLFPLAVDPRFREEFMKVYEDTAKNIDRFKDRFPLLRAVKKFLKAYKALSNKQGGEGMLQIKLTEQIRDKYFPSAHPKYLKGKGRCLELELDKALMDIITRLRNYGYETYADPGGNNEEFLLDLVKALAA